MNYGDFSSKVNGKVVHKAVRALFLMLFAVLLWCACVAPSMCQGKEITAPEENVSLSLRQCVELLLTNNLHLKVERYNPYLQEKEIIKEKAVFDPLARLSLHDQKIVISPTTLLNGVGNSQSYER